MMFQPVSRFVEAVRSGAFELIALNVDDLLECEG
jgi:hypothetical protein